MQKISSYLLHNRVELVADLAGHFTEYRTVYKRQIKVYRGVDNVLEFDIKNADQKRINLTDYTLKLNVMDNQGLALPNSPYTITKLNQTTYKGLATATIPADDLNGLVDQFLTYSVTTSDDKLFYADTRFGASGSMQLLGGVVPVTRTATTYDYFNGLGDFNNTTITYFSDALNVRFRDAVPPTTAEIVVTLDQLDGSIWVEATKDSVLGNESFTYKGTRLATHNVTPNLTTYTFNVTVEDYRWIRVNYTKDPKVTTGKIVQFTINFS